MRLWIIQDRGGTLPIFMSVHLIDLFDLRIVFQCVNEEIIIEEIKVGFKVRRIECTHLWKVFA